ncbi:MAG: glutaredoxin family protein [Deltaproteobacteria bacterium]|nr:glutaredoxin family protein [Deltaproteobacteria bacterium]
MPPIKIYTLSTCSHCKSAKALLNECSVPFDAVDVDRLDGDARKEAIEAVREVNPNLSFPTLIIGDTVIVGFKEEAIRKALDQ